MSVLALIPARAGSKGARDKNRRELGGRTLIGHALQCSHDAGVDTTAITTDYVTLGGDLGYWPPFMYIPRPPELAQDDTPMIAVVEHALREVPGPDDQIIVLLQPTQPFRTPAHITKAINLLRETQADSVVSVTQLPLSHGPELVCEIDDGRLKPMMCAGRWRLMPTTRQKALPVYRRDGTVYAFWRRTAREHGTLYGDDVRPLIIPAEETCELDTEADWADVERRWHARHAH